MNVPDIVRQLLTLHQGKQEILAAGLGVSQATVSRWLKGSDPKGAHRDKITALARKSGLLDTQQPTVRRQASANRFLMVPTISWVSAGRLADSDAELSASEAPKIAVADLGDGDFFALRVSGTSMDRISPDKSIIVVNRSQKALHDGKPYVFAVRGEATFKLWRATPARLEPFSTDPSNEPIFLDKRQSVIVIGRVRRSILDL